MFFSDGSVGLHIRSIITTWYRLTTVRVLLRTLLIQDYFLRKYAPNQMLYRFLYTLKTPGSAWPGNGSVGAKLHSGSTITAEISQLDAKYDPELGQSDPIICQFDWFPGHRWHGMEFGPDGPFSRSRLTRVFLECNLFFKTSPKVMLRKIISVINSTWESFSAVFKICHLKSFPSPKSINRIRVTYMLAPRHLNSPFSGKRYVPLISGIGKHWL